MTLVLFVVLEYLVITCHFPMFPSQTEAAAAALVIFVAIKSGSYKSSPLL